MTSEPGRRSGNALVESLFIFPLLSLMLVAVYASGNTLSMLSTAESASHAEGLRAARRQSSVADKWNSAFAASEKPFRFDQSSGSGARLLPSPFPSLSGRQTSAVTLDREWDPWTRSALRIDKQRIERKDELSGDCWENGTGSGRKIRNTVKLLVGTGVL